MSIALEPMAETKRFAPASKEWLNKSLLHSSYFKELGLPGQERVYSLFCRQLADDAHQQEKILRQNFIDRQGVPHDVSLKAGGMLQKTKQLLSTGPFTYQRRCLLEEEIERNWSVAGQGNPTIPDMLQELVHAVGMGFEYAPVKQKGRGHSYARADGIKEDLIQPHIDAIKAHILHELPKGVDQDMKILLAGSGSSILPAILQTLQFEGRWHMDPSFNERFILQILSENPYFEAGKAIKSMKPVGAFVFPGVTYFPPSSQRLSGPTVDVVSTESRAQHIQNIDRSLGEGGICCFYAEPIGNNPAMDVPNLRKAIDTIKAARKTDQAHRKIFLIIDTSIMGGKFDLTPFFSSEDFKEINVIVTESANKYLSYGTNKGNFGIVYGLGPDTKWLFDSLQDKFQMNGLPKYSDILAVPLPDEEIIIERKKRFNDNAHFLTGNLEKLFKRKFSISYPGLEKHPQFERAKNDYDFQGGVFYITIPKEELPRAMGVSDEEYNRLKEEHSLREDTRLEKEYAQLEQLLPQSKTIGYGTSYGFNETRAEVIRRKEENSNEKKAIGLRVSVGTENIRKLILVLEEFKTILDQV